MRLKKIAVLLHEKDIFFDSTDYLLRLLINKWREKGLTVEILKGIKRFIPADIIIPHLDLTVIPAEYRNFINQYPNIINRRVIDISKSVISNNIMARDDDYTGPVIVKTDRNYGGMPEKRLQAGASSSSSLASNLMSKIASRLGWGRAERTETASWSDIECIKPSEYPIFPSLREVPQEIFDNNHLVVEKFLPEVEGDNYLLRYYYFFGDREINILLKSKEKIIKGSNVFECEEAPVPSELRSIRKQLGFDYGKLDYVLRDGRVVLFDANRTPSFTTLEMRQLTDRVASHLAEGVQRDREF